ncbi:hypothetical protein AB0B45_31065 [Nonomuraea sp. NPDC049152]|uniref:hypothetical protein n=1 Tax=Nonomuraea sp. NPDC049152 TaxID=3154350 RepID=UPI0033C38E38
MDANPELINDPNGRDELLSRQAIGEKPLLPQDARDFDASGHPDFRRVRHSR